MNSMEKVLSSELGQKLAKIQEQVKIPNMNYRENEIGEKIIKQWNSFKLKDKYPFAEVAEEFFNKAIKEIIPDDAILSSRMESWINKERNQLMTDSRLNNDNYFKNKFDFEAGKITEEKNTHFEILEKKQEFLEKEINSFCKALKTTMENKPELFYADKEALTKWENYYSNRIEQVKQALEIGDFSQYSLNNKVGTKENAENHLSRLEQNMNKVRQQSAELSNDINDMSKTEEFKNSETKDYTSNIKKQNR